MAFEAISTASTRRCELEPMMKLVQARASVEAWRLQWRPFSAEESGRDHCGQASRHGACNGTLASMRQPQESVMKRKASAVWQGGLQDGKGSISTDSGVLKDTQYSFSTRFESGVGTNPEELIAAAHAGCFSMALSAELGKAGIKPERIATTATVTLDKDGGGFSLTASHLDVVVKIPGGDKAKFEKAAADAKAGCPISKVLNATITMDAKLET
jgi:osmotically inducible protein OsmC